ncbi:MAG: hypothetical protein U0Q16_18130 [Bryobacteraceae bacterium]
MTVTLHLPSQVEQAYRAYAAAKGVTVDEVVRDIVIAGLPSAAPLSRLSPDEWERQFEEWADSLGPSPAAVDPAAREDIYADRW